MNRKVRILLAFVIAIGMLLFSYWVTNQRYAISGETALMRKIELVKGWFKPHLNPMADSVLLINVSYDTVLEGAYDNYNLPVGLEQITDRKKLFQLLKELKRKNDYKYITLDILFTDDIHTEIDSALFDLIASMDRIAIARDYKRGLADELLIPKSGTVNYFTNYKFVSFAKYPYLIDNQKSLPLKMYEDVTGRHIERHGMFSMDGYRLVRESVVLFFDLRCDSAYTLEGEKTWYNLGMDLLGSKFIFGNDTIPGTPELYSNPELTKGKYIVIGAFSKGDMHYSYLENQPGPAILFNAYLALLHGHHIISFGVSLLLFVSFFILSFLILGRQTIDEAIAEEAGNNKIANTTRRILGVAASWIGYSMFLTMICAITYLWMGEVYDIFITATVFQLISIIVNQLYKFKRKSNHE